ncbi:YcaO-like family protein [Pigmentibacter sp. JX0631]|uniref:YcaO-like family protein n=1 Tax=Pigmentibacter sp. JX0631 TaxID=2976982 RepID=UPI002469BC60|nr:YcaO-like family protein [Pigmentibacter sp. JX0631]WGL58984.1 YcaO-like family protein [Pigmentibacter sp. JX0631]
MHNNGYLISKSFFDSMECDNIVSKIKEYTKRKYDSIIALDQADLIVPEIKDLLTSKKLINFLENYINNDLLLASSKLYVRANRQPPFYDSLQISSYPLNKLLSVWIALEDVIPLNSPMYYYPESHLRTYPPLYERILDSNFTVLNNYVFYESAYEEDLKDYNFKSCVRKIFLPRKGDFMLMHGNLIHGDLGPFDYSKARASLLAYFLPKNENKYYFTDYPLTKKEKKFDTLRAEILPKIFYSEPNENNSSEKTPEREILPAKAVENLFTFFKDNKFQIDLNSLGEKIISYECLIEKSSSLNSYGYGKGSSEIQCIASAMFESFEHLISKGFFVNSEKTVFISIKVALQDWTCFPEKILEKCKEDQEPLLWDIFNGLNTNENLIIPSVILDTPGGNRSLKGNFPFFKLDGAFSNSGTAAGSTYSEAVLHSLNELIERDAHSLLLIKTFCKNTPCNLRIINKETLPETLKLILADCEREVGYSFTLIDMTTDFNIPAIACFTHKIEGTDRPILGYGCSPSADYAVERAILETVQTWHSYLRDKRKFIESWNSIDVHVAKIEKMRLAAQENYQEIIEKGLYEIIDYSILKELSLNNFGDISHFAKNVEIVLNKIIKIFSNKNMNIYVKKLFDNQNTGLVCVRSIVRELEVFNLITSGLLVAPSKRGIKILNN